jgi:post-segregation antitoxin (ccd killing protein)
MTELTVTLPDELANKARAAGLLNAEGIERALREALKRDAARRLLKSAKRYSQPANRP